MTTTSRSAPEIIGSNRSVATPSDASSEPAAQVTNATAAIPAVGPSADAAPPITTATKSWNESAGP